MNIEKKILPYLVVISALSVSASAVFYSVTGLGKMFAGASTNVMIMVGSLEIAKLVLASLVYQYWSKIGLLLKFYYIIAVLILMMITSGGIYGFLSSAYSETSNKIEKIDREVDALGVRRNVFNIQMTDISEEKTNLNDNINELTKALSNNVIQYRDQTTGQIITTTSSANRKAFEKQLEDAQNRRNVIVEREMNLLDSLTKIDLLVLELQNNEELAGEIGPLKYIATITGKTIDQVVNWFIIALMLVFDPLAVSLVIGANIIFSEKSKSKNKENDDDSNNLVINDNLDEKSEDNLDIDNSIEIEKEKLADNKTDNSIEIEDELKKKFEDLEIKLKEREGELNNRERELKEKQDYIENNSNFLYEKIKDEEASLIKTKEELKKDIEKIKIEKENLKTDKERIKNELSELEEEKDDILYQQNKLSSLEEDLKKRENELENTKDELISLNNEIKKWENLHWKLKRNRKPPSAL
jgi:chromosome segregation ATPase